MENSNDAVTSNTRLDMQTFRRFALASPETGSFAEAAGRLGSSYSASGDNGAQGAPLYGQLAVSPRVFQRPYC